MNNIDEQKIVNCLILLKKYFKNREDLAEVDYPKNIDYGSEEWLVYNFYSCLLDYGMKSKVYHENLIRTYYEYPFIFNPRHVVDNYLDSSSDLLLILKENVHPRYPNVAVDKWINLSKELVKYEKVMDRIKSFESFNELSYFVRTIKGFGQKTGGLLLRLISDSGVCSFNEEVFYIPLDRHDIEICYMNEFISTKKLTNTMIEDLSRSLILAGNKVGLSASKVDKYLWEIGNCFCNRKDCESCPLCKTCTKKVK